MQPTSIKWYLRNLCVLCLYALFFSVELVYSLEAQKPFPSGATVVTRNASHPVFSQSGAANTLQKINCRLNKRFQPSFASRCNNILPEIFTGYADQAYNSIYSRKPQLDIFLLSGPLRAPPVI
ncbi:MAG TPA: hypothetical protein VHD35_07430 [Chitinophagaceae bacterium]|nr:hypothetical protein [Chitinophagaceae bacterium]